MTAAATILALRVIHQPKLWPASAGYAVCAAAAMHVHYYAAFVILAHNFFVLFLMLRNIWKRRAQRRAGPFWQTWRPRDRALLMRWALAHGNVDRCPIRALVGQRMADTYRLRR